MKDYYIYCIVDEKGEIQRGTGSSQQTKFFEKPNQPLKWCEYNNKRHGKKWITVKVKLELVGVIDLPLENKTSDKEVQDE